MLNFKTSCVYCNRNTTTALHYCECGNTVCDIHIPIHRFKAHHELFVFINGTVRSATMSGDECSAAEEEIKIEMEKNKDKNFTMIKEECVHLHGSGVKPEDEESTKVESSAETNKEEDKNKTNISTDYEERSKLNGEYFLMSSKQALSEKRSKEDENKNKTKIEIKAENCCSDCDLKEHLWVCFECGNFGCGRKQYGVEGNGHAHDHYVEKKHPVAVLVKSIDVYGNNDTFCYDCNDFIKNKNLGARIKTERRESKSFQCVAAAANENEKKKKDSEEEKESETNDSLLTQGSTVDYADADGQVVSTKPAITKGEKKERKRIKELIRKHVGIKNMGNTCYISSVMQLLASVVTVENEHFYDCSIDPLSCMNCQMNRVINCINMHRCNLEVDSTIEEVPITDFLNLIYTNFTIFTPGVQQDASEFFLFFINCVKQDKFCFEIDYLSECECGRTDRQTAENLFLLVPFRNKVSDAVNTSMAAMEWNCPCGKIGKKTPHFRILPEFLLVFLNRIAEDGSKINDDVEVDNLAILNFVETIASPKKIEELRKMGYSHQECAAALALSNNNIEKAGNILITHETEARNERKYEFKCAICHVGDSVYTGHYTCIINVEGVLLHIDDLDVKIASEEDLKRAYVICYK